ncbi:hypothetical protein V6N13_143423 [Hibiscus sabdariffa]|uniref:RNase H type-1 domain-containing protein n=1 Tax=Hibiscus sabdariffa TaxID=183260 RepID=A0ABR2FH93_9ROSI
MKINALLGTAVTFSFQSFLNPIGVFMGLNPKEKPIILKELGHSEMYPVVVESDNLKVVNLLRQPAAASLGCTPQLCNTLLLHFKNIGQLTSTSQKPPNTRALL